jgi:hypothetical protein
VVAAGGRRAGSGVVVVTASSVPPLVPRAVHGGFGAGPVGRGRRRLPVPALEPGPPRAAGAVYALSAVDKSGRVADRSVVRALGWAPGTRLDIREQAGIIAAPDGVCRVDGRGHLRLPLAARRRCRLAVGDRVLLAADCAAGVLLAHPLAALDRLLAGARAAAVRG